MDPGTDFLLVNYIRTLECKSGEILVYSALWIVQDYYDIIMMPSFLLGLFGIMKIPSINLSCSETKEFLGLNLRVWSFLCNIEIDSMIMEDRGEGVGGFGGLAAIS